MHTRNFLVFYNMQVSSAIKKDSAGPRNNFLSGKTMWTHDKNDHLGNIFLANASQPPVVLWKEGYCTKLVPSNKKVYGYS